VGIELSKGKGHLNKTYVKAAERLRILIEEANAIANGEALRERKGEAVSEVGGQSAIDALFGARKQAG
jgi:hypothetical protein